MNINKDIHDILKRAFILQRQFQCKMHSDWEGTMYFALYDLTKIIFADNHAIHNRKGNYEITMLCL